MAIAIACRPALLIADEPTTALDVTIQAEILDLLREMRHSLGLAMLLITHDLGVIAETADRVAVMYAGRIVEQGPVRDVLRDPAASLHSGPAGVAARRRARGPVATDRGHGPAARLVPARVHVPSAVPRTLRAMRQDSRRRRIRSDPTGMVRCFLHDPVLGVRRPDVADQRGSAPPMPMPLVEISNLTRQFTRGGGLLRHGTTVVRRGRCELQHRGGRDVRPGRRVGQRQDDDRAVPAAPDRTHERGGPVQG